MEFPVDRLRAETPGCNSIIHFGNAGCSLPPKVVSDTVAQFIREEALYGGYEYAALRQADIDDFYTAAAAMLHCNERNIAFVNSSTDGFARALSSVPFTAGDVILTTLTDYISSQIHFLSLEKRFGVKIVRANNAATGETDLDDLEACIKKYNPVLVSVTHVPNNSGMVQPIEAIGDLCKKYDIWYLVDACQSAGQLPLNVEKIGCDFLAFATRKFMRGPRGGGVLFVSDVALEANLEPLYIDMRGAEWTAPNTYTPVPDAKRFEYTEQSYAVLTGAAVAMRYYLAVGPEKIADRNKYLSDYLRSCLQEFGHIHLLDRGKQLSAIHSLVSDKTSPTDFRNALFAHKIQVNAAPQKFALIDFLDKKVDGAVRIAPHYYNTTQEIDAMIEVIRKYDI